MQTDVDPRTGTPLIVARVAPGVQGASTGTQGIGVRTPSAAVVAAATDGLASDRHIPKVGTLTLATSSITPAGVVLETDWPHASIVAGHPPTGHANVAPVATIEVMGRV